MTVWLSARHPLTRTRLSGLDRHWLYSPIPGHLDAQCQWQGCDSSHYKSLNPQNEFETIVLGVEILRSAFLNVTVYDHNQNVQAQL